MNFIRQTLSAALLIASGVSAVAAPAIQAPSPQVDVQWALAAVEMPEATHITLPRPTALLASSHRANTWQFRSRVGGQQVEVVITELMTTVAQQLAQQAIASARELAGL